MKKLLVLIGIMLLTICTYGQKAPKCNTNPYNSIIHPCADYQFYDYGTQPYGFILNGNKYIMSYDTLINKEVYNTDGTFNSDFIEEVSARPVFLFYSPDNGKNWIVASMPIQYDSYIYNFETGKYHKKYYWTGEGAYKTGDPNGLRVKIIDNKNVEISIINRHEVGNNAYYTNEIVKVKIND